VTDVRTSNSTRSLPCSQQPATGDYPQPYESRLQNPILYLGLPSDLFPTCLRTKIVCYLHSHTCYMSCSSHRPWFHRPNIWRGLQLTRSRIEKKLRGFGPLANYTDRATAFFFCRS
jgi:hypothetical protein